MKKLILLALAAAGVGVLVKNKSEQLKAGAAKVTSDPRVQSALATASERTAPLKEKAAPYAGAVREKAGPVADAVREKAGPVADAVKEKAGPVAGTVAGTVKDKVSAAQERLHKTDGAADGTPGDVPSAEGVAPEPADPFQGGDPLTDPLPEDRPAE